MKRCTFGVIFAALISFVPYFSHAHATLVSLPGPVTTHEEHFCIFCDIIHGSQPADYVTQTENLIVIKDKTPKAPTHFLIIPKKHIENVKYIDTSDASLLQEMIFIAQKLSHHLAGSGDFSLVMRNGYKAKQTVFHLHMHFMSPEPWYQTRGEL